MITSALQRCFKKLIWIVLFPAYFLAAEEQSYVTCQLEGQLGNQFFQIAATLAYAWDNDARPIFPELNKNEWNIPYNHQHIFFRLDDSPLPRPPQNSYHHYYFNSDKIPYRPDQYLVGYYQAWQLFHHHREKILEAFAPSESIDNYLNGKYSELIAHPNTVAVHVRTQSPWVHNDSGGLFFVGLSYFERAMDLFDDDTLFVVFSDRINWCKHHFSKLQKNIVYIEDDYIYDLFLISKMKHQIISNSTFSWWSAYLNTNPDKIVVTPRYWFNPKNYPDVESVNFPDWIILDVEYDAPYPADMRSYDAQSKSFDNQ